jgi:ribosomal protein L5
VSGRLLERYHSEVAPALSKQFGYTNPMQVPFASSASTPGGS